MSSGSLSAALGYNNTASGNYSSAVGHLNTALANYSSSFGCRVYNTVVHAQEFGYWSTLTTRAGAVRIHGTGMVACTIENRSTPYSDGGTTPGAEADGTLMRGAYSIRYNGTSVYLDLNIAGSITTVNLTGGGGGGGSSWTHGTGTPIANSISTVTYGLYTNDADSTLWTVAGGAWTAIA